MTPNPRRNFNDGTNKYCPECDDIKPLDQFNTDNSRWDKLSRLCAQHMSQRVRQWQIDHRETYNAGQRERWKRNNPRKGRHE